MDPDEELPPQANRGDRIDSIANRWLRIRALLIQRWWILLLTVSAGLSFQAWRISRTTDEFISNAQLVAGGSISLKKAGNYREDVQSFFGTQSQILQSGELHKRVRDRIKLMHPNLSQSEVILDVKREKESAVFNISARGPESDYVHAYLDALLEEYINFRQEMRSRASDDILDAITKELAKLEDKVDVNQKELTDFLENNNVIVLEEGGNNSASFLASLNQERARLQTELNLLRRLDIDQNINRRNHPSPNPGLGEEEAGLDPTMKLADSERDFLRTKQEIQLLLAERERRSAVLKEKHPVMRALEKKLELSQTMLAIHRAQSEELNASRIKALELSITNLDAEITSWEEKTMETNQKLARYSLRKAQLNYAQKLHQDLLLSLHQVDQTRHIAQDAISVMESASPAKLVIRPHLKPLLVGTLAGLFIGGLLLFALDRLDDRMHSTGDYLASFTETLLTVVPNMGKAGSLPLISEGDTRYMFVEAYRQLRSSIIFNNWDWDSDTPPKIILITSGIPAEGKSTTAANLAITLALAGSRCLLIDADLRRGSLKEWFGATAVAGFSEVINGEAEVDAAISATEFDNLSIMPCGSANVKAFNPVATLKVLDSLRDSFEFIIIDSAPLLVVDDTSSLAPIIDMTLVVMRLNKTPTRVGQQTLSRLIERQAQIGGVILNCDEGRLSNYKTYGYNDYYEAVEVQAKKSLAKK